MYELLNFSDTLKQLYVDDAHRDQLWNQALKDGLTPMPKDGMLKVKEGVTTPAEVMRVLFSL